jgi:hypothetical protein
MTIDAIFPAGKALSATIRGFSSKNKADRFISTLEGDNEIVQVVCYERLVPKSKSRVLGYFVKAKD